MKVGIKIEWLFLISHSDSTLLSIYIINAKHKICLFTYNYNMPMTLYLNITKISFMKMD